MSRSVARRSPNKLGGFSWGRFPMGLSGIVVYRLFLRDHSGAVHFVGLNFYRRAARRDMSIALRAACHRLRAQVEEINRAATGGTP
ncbi:hypothetical protein [Stenotrophomonas sp. JAI102]|uniref:hypothetical protein n=1 Tax=Stenotrophomonas sp. JAI102 TaxID=2723077 RepID=UPI0015CAA546|nr:hypothetical protein [Stenotrophomonas sp. JAI102]NYF34440.1 hypothetical protein [Stenotrophomonas sp. JAI102]